MFSEGLALLEETTKFFLEFRHDDEQSRGELVTILATAAPRAALANSLQGFVFAAIGEKAASDAILLTELAADDVHIGFLKNQRAFLRTVMLQNCGEISDDLKEQFLSKIIADYEDSYVHNLGGDGWPVSLIQRANLFFDSDRMVEATADAELALEKVELLDKERKEQVAAVANAMLHKIGFKVAQESMELGELAQRIDSLVGLSPASDYHLVYLLSQLRSLYEDAPVVHPELSEAVHRLLLHAREIAKSMPDSSGAFFVASYAANLCRNTKLKSSELVVDLYRLATELDTEHKPEVRIFAGNTALEFGKSIRGTKGADVGAFFEEATLFYEAGIDAINTSTDPLPDFLDAKVIYSKAGEAFLRFARYSEEPIIAYTRAAALLAESERQGNETAANLGMQGDVFYRLGVLEHNLDQLRVAASFKQRARESGAIERENYSVSSRIYERIYWSNNKIEDLSQSISLVLSAISSFPDWGWPYFQIWTMISKYSRVWDAAMKDVKFDQGAPTDSNLMEAASARDLDYFAESGTRATCASKEFERRKLGGRSWVFVIDDDHGLLGSTVVLKPTKRGDAEREAAVASALGNSIRRIGASRKFSAIEPICTTAIDPNWDLELPEKSNPDVIFATRFTSGADVASRIVALQKNSKYIEPNLVKDLVDLLGLYHNLTPTSTMDCGSTNFIEFFRSISSKVGIKVLQEAAAPLGETILPCAQKKDAHAENWILADDGRLVAIDLEATSRQPVLADLSQIFDDYPTLPPTEAGMGSRLDLATEYISKFDGAHIPRAKLRLCVELFALWRVSVMLGYLDRQSRRTDSTSTLRAYSLRRSHLNALAETIRDHGSSRAVSSIAHSFCEN